MNCNRFLLAVALSISAIGGASAQVATYTYKVVDGHEIRADVHRPAGEEIRPAVVFIHGGACIFGSRVDSPPMPLRDKLLQAGYVIVSIDYRLAPETKLDQIVKDVADACTWVREGPRLFAIDPDRIAVMGGSAGGYLALMAGWRVTPRPRAVVAISGYGDLAWYETPTATIPPSETKKALAAVGNAVLSSGGGARAPFYQYCRKHKCWIREVAGINPAREPSKFDALLPIENVTANYPPALLVHSRTDSDVPYMQAVRMRDELDRKGVANEFITVEQGHSSGLIRQYPAVSDSIVAFLNARMTATGGKNAGGRKTNYGDFKGDEWKVRAAGAVMQEYKGKRALRLQGRYALAYLRDMEFRDGTIEADIAAPGKGQFFLGVAFRVQEEFEENIRVNDNNSQKYEYIYFRPFASGTENAIQYCAAGTRYSWSYLRDNHPGVYEARVNLPESDWFHVKIVVSGRRAEVYVDDSRTPNLVVEDLKHGLSEGSVGLYSYHQTAYFANLTVTPSTE